MLVKVLMPSLFILIHGATFGWDSGAVLLFAQKWPLTEARWSSDLRKSLSRWSATTALLLRALSNWADNNELIQLSYLFPQTLTHREVDRQS